MPSNDTQHSIGSILDATAQRDAVHIAVAPIVAAQRLYPGHAVALNARGEAVQGWEDGEGIGIVDPFLMNEVSVGQRFWVFLYPNTVTNLRHHWAHPAFPDTITPTVPDGPREWLTRFAMAHEVSYPELIGMLDAYLMRGEEGFFGTDIDYDAIPEMWTQYERLKGGVVPESQRVTPFRCGC